MMTIPSALIRMSTSFCKTAAASVKPSGDANHDLAWWEATMAEVHEGYVTGPFDARDVPKEVFFAAQPNERLSLVGHLDPSQ